MSPSSEPALSDLLSRGTALALKKGIEVLSMSLDPSDRNWANLLRSQQAIANTLITAKLRVDEATFKSERDESREKCIANIIERIKAAVALGGELEAEGARRPTSLDCANDDGRDGGCIDGDA
jgi:hypothetical protein